MPGDAGILTTDGTLPDGEVMYLQRVLADSAHVKLCNLSGGDLPRSPWLHASSPSTSARSRDARHIRRASQVQGCSRRLSRKVIVRIGRLLNPVMVVPERLQTVIETVSAAETRWP